jgi:putative redox protein
MAMDVVHVVEKGRHRLEAMTVTFEGKRAEHPPRRFETMAVHFQLTGEIPPAVVERAIALSREKYCSVWHTIRPDVELTTTFSIEPPTGG